MACVMACVMACDGRMFQCCCNDIVRCDDHDGLCCPIFVDVSVVMPILPSFLREFIADPLTTDGAEVDLS